MISHTLTSGVTQPLLVSDKAAEVKCWLSSQCEFLWKELNSSRAKKTLVRAAVQKPKWKGGEVYGTVPQEKVSATWSSLNICIRQDFKKTKQRNVFGCKSYIFPHSIMCVFTLCVCIIVSLCACFPLCAIYRLFFFSFFIFCSVFGVGMTASLSLSLFHFFPAPVPMCGWSWTNKASFLFDCVHSVKHSVCN